MQFTISTTFFTLAALIATVSAIADPGNPANLVNCEPGGGADDCHLEQPCSRIRINYGSTQQGHYIWYNYDINNVPAGAVVETEDSCTD